VSGQPPQPTSEQAMMVHVTQAQLRLNDGALVRETLEYLWRVAFAAGVRTGQVPLESRRLDERARQVEQARADGWRFGLPASLGIVSGVRFRYGGTDRAGPNCDREAIAHPPKMELLDTGGRVKMPGICWVWNQMQPEEAGNAT